MYAAAIALRRAPHRLKVRPQHALLVVRGFLRLALQLQRALKKNPKSSDFGGLNYYLDHCADTHGHVKAVAFERHVASLQRDEASFLKAQRQAREERGAEEKRRRDGKKGKNGKDGKDDE